MNNNVSLYSSVVKITNVYLGPAAERFINRQIINHLNKQPEDLSQGDLTKLIDWIQLAVSLLTEDSGIVEEYIKQLRVLSQSPTKK